MYTIITEHFCALLGPPLTGDKPLSCEQSSVLSAVGGGSLHDLHRFGQD